MTIEQETAGAAAARVKAFGRAAGAPESIIERNAPIRRMTDEMSTLRPRNPSGDRQFAERKYVSSRSFRCEPRERIILQGAPQRH